MKYTLLLPQPVFLHYEQRAIAFYHVLDSFVLILMEVGMRETSTFFQQFQSTFSIKLHETVPFTITPAPQTSGP